MQQAGSIPRKWRAWALSTKFMDKYLLKVHMVGPIQVLRATEGMKIIAKTRAIFTGRMLALMHCQNWALQLMSHTQGKVWVRRSRDSWIIDNGINRQNGQCECQLLKKEWVRGSSFNLLFPKYMHFLMVFESFFNGGWFSSHLRLRHPSCIFKETCTRYSLRQATHTDSQC